LASLVKQKETEPVPKLRFRNRLNYYCGARSMKQHIFTEERSFSVAPCERATRGNYAIASLFQITSLFFPSEAASSANPWSASYGNYY
jgi:hypothetical protein